MRKNLNRKGFTLIELLAVIIVLALVMIFAVPSVLDASSASQKKTFKLYAQKVLTEAQNYYQLETMKGTAITTITGCHSLANIGLTGTGDYTGSVKIEQVDDVDADDNVIGQKIQYTVYLANQNFAYVGATADVVNGTTEPDALADADVSHITNCGVE